jgi:very-short-patch-repair endonuclease
MKDRIIRGQNVRTEMLKQAKLNRRQMTHEERILWDRLRAVRLGGFHFRRQQVIGSFIVDFYCHTCGLVVEIDGRMHDHQAEQDADRQQWLESLGLKVIRFKNEEIREDLEGVLNDILARCKDLSH